MANFFKVLKVRKLNADEPFVDYIKVLECARNEQLKAKSIASHESINNACEALSVEELYGMYVRIMLAPSPLKLFGLDRQTFTPEALNKIRKDLLRVCHPDKQGSASVFVKSAYTELAKQIGAAYTSLLGKGMFTGYQSSSEGSQAEEDDTYDFEEEDELPKAKKPKAPPKPPKAPKAPKPEKAEKKKKPEQYKKPPRPQASAYTGPIEKQVINIYVSFQDLYIGCKKHINVSSGILDEKTGKWNNIDVPWTVNIEPRTCLGIFQIARGMGMYNFKDKYRCDVHFNAVEMDKRHTFNIKGYDIETTLTISWITAIGGGTIDVIFPDGTSQSVTHVRYQEGQILEFSNKGMRNPSTKSCGAFLAKVHFLVPELSVRQQQTFQKFAAQLTTLNFKERERLFEYFEKAPPPQTDDDVHFLF